VPGDTSLGNCPAPEIAGSWEQAVVVAALRQEVARLRELDWVSRRAARAMAASGALLQTWPMSVRELSW
jgi:hypothetical protein